MNWLVITDLEVMCIRIKRWIVTVAGSVEQMTEGYRLIQECREFQHDLLRLWCTVENPCEANCNKFASFLT